MNDNVQELLYNIGAFCEFMKVLSDNLEKQGFTQQERIEYCKEYMRCTFIKDYGRDVH